MWGWAFINRIAQNWQDKPWRKYDDTCPYWMGHRKEHQPEFVARYWFNVYCKGSKRLRKFYWKIHKDERCIRNETP